MDASEFGKRIAELLRSERDRGSLAPLPEYQRRYPGQEEEIAREYEIVTGASSPDWLPHRERERYTQLGEIARGGMGAILRVRDESLGRDLAMKVVLGDGGRIDPASPEGRGPLARRFLEEARITARLDHPGVVPVHELGADAEGRLFFTMKLIKGGRTLAEVFRLAREGAPEFARSRVIEILVRVLETLAFAHEKGVIHRDLKPANVMVGDFGEVYVMDWGLAKVAGAAGGSEPAAAETGAGGSGTGLTEAGQVLGTPAYMPIEQARNEDLDARADIYAVGAMLYEFVSGIHPFGEKGRTTTNVEVLLGMLKGPPPPLGSVAREAPTELVSVIDKAMAREKGDRYATAMDLARDLRNFVEGRVVGAHEAGTWAELRKWVGRNQALACSIAAAVLLLVVGLATSIRLGLKADRERDAARRHAYRAGIGAAVADLANQDLYAARLRLEQTPEEMRGWEWRHLMGRLDESLLVIEGTGMAFSAEGALRVVDRAGVVREYDLSRGTVRLLATVQREGAEAWISKDGGTVCMVKDRPGDRDGYDVSFAAAEGGTVVPTAALRIWDRKWDRGCRMPRFVYSGMDGRIHVRDPFTGAERTPKPFAEGPETRLMATTSNAGTSDGRFLLLEQVDRALVFDLETERVLLSATYARYARPSGMAVDPARSRVAFLGEDGAIEIRDLATGECAAFGRLQAHAREGFLAFDPTGRILATGGRDRSVRLFDASSGALIRTLQGHVNMVQEGTFTPDGEYLVTRDAGDAVRVWVARGTDPTVLRGHASYVYAVGFSPDGERVYSGGWDGFLDQGGSLRIWDAATGTPIAALGDGASGTCIFTLALTRDGSRIVTVGGEQPDFRGGPLRVWDAETGRVVREFPGSYRTVGLHPDGRRAVALHFGTSMESEGDACQVLDIESGALLASFLPKPVTWAAYSVNPACSPDGRWIALPDPDAADVVIWDAATYRPVRRIVSGRGKVTSITFSPDGSRLLTTADDESWSVWDAATGARIALQAGTGNEVLCGVYAPGGRWILTGGRDRTLRVWDARSFEEIARLPGHDDYIKSVAARPDGEVLASASGDATIRLWQTRTAAELHAAQIRRRALVAELSPKVTALFERLKDPKAVIARIKAEHEGREREVALQIALAESSR